MPVFRPQVGRAGKFIEGERRFRCRALAGAVVEHEPVAVGGKDKGDVQRGGIIQSLLHPVADGVGVVLGFDQGDGEIGLVIEDIVGPLGFAAGDELAANDDSAFGERDLATNLRCLIPAGLNDRWRDALGANIGFAEGLFVHFLSLIATLEIREIAIPKSVTCRAESARDAVP